MAFWSGAVRDGDAGGLLAAMLEGVEAPVGEAGGVGVVVDGHDAALLVEFVETFFGGCGGLVLLRRENREQTASSSGVTLRDSRLPDAVHKVMLEWLLRNQAISDRSCQIDYIDPDWQVGFTES